MSARDTSADSAARFLRGRAYRRSRNRCSRCGIEGHNRNSWRCPQRRDRIKLDFAEQTLAVIHKILCDAIAPPEFRPHYLGEDLDRLLIAEQMVATALGLPPCDDPPLTDREVR